SARFGGLDRQAISLAGDFERSQDPELHAVSSAINRRYTAADQAPSVSQRLSARYLHTHRKDHMSQTLSQQHQGELHGKAALAAVVLSVLAFVGVGFAIN